MNEDVISGYNSGKVILTTLDYGNAQRIIGLSRDPDKPESSEKYKTFSVLIALSKSVPPLIMTCKGRMMTARLPVCYSICRTTPYPPA